MDKEQDIETELRSLFDAHARVVKARERVLENYDDSDTRGAVIDSFKAARHRIADTAVDRVLHHAEVMKKYDDD